jgi:hypothetical protein
LLEGNLWRQLAAKGYEYVKQVFVLDKAIDQHLAAYECLLNPVKL